MIPLPRSPSWRLGALGGGLGAATEQQYNGKFREKDERQGSLDNNLQALLITIHPQAHTHSRYLPMEGRAYTRGGMDSFLALWCYTGNILAFATTVLKLRLVSGAFWQSTWFCRQADAQLDASASRSCMLCYP
jgi:hypothetical protein